MEAFNSLNSFIDRRLEALVGILLPWAADPDICSVLNTLATGATDFTCKAWVRASIAAPLISRFAIAVLRCTLEQGQQGGGCWQLAGSHLEAVCSCVRMAFKSLDDALRIVASAPDGQTDLKRCAVSRTWPLYLPAVAQLIMDRKLAYERLAPTLLYPKSFSWQIS